MFRVCEICFFPSNSTSISSWRSYRGSILRKCSAKVVVLLPPCCGRYGERHGTTVTHLWSSVPSWPLKCRNIRTKRRIAGRDRGGRRGPRLVVVDRHERIVPALVPGEADAVRWVGVRRVCPAPAGWQRAAVHREALAAGGVGRVEM